MTPKGLRYPFQKIRTQYGSRQPRQEKEQKIDGQNRVAEILLENVLFLVPKSYLAEVVPRNKCIWVQKIKGRVLELTLLLDSELLFVLQQVLKVLLELLHVHRIILLPEKHHYQVLALQRT